MLISSLTFLTRCWPLGLFEILFNFLEISFINRSPHKIKTPPIFLFCCKFSRTPRLWVCCFVSPEGCTFVEKFQYSAAWWERHLNLCFYWTLRWSNDKSWVTNRKLLKSSTIHLLSPKWSDEAIGGKITKKEATRCWQRRLSVTLTSLSAICRQMRHRIQLYSKDLR